MNVAAFRVESAQGRWSRHEWRPAPGEPLAAVVESITHCDGEATLPRERLFPDTTVELVVHVGQPHRLVSADGVTPLAGAFLSGVQSGPLTLEAPPGRVAGLNITLRPAGAYAVLAQPLSGLSGRVLELHGCIGRAAGELLALCEGAATAEERIRRAAGWVAARLARAPAASAAVAWAAGEIERHGGAVAISALRDRAGLSPARFTAVFREQTGVSPKRYARIARFRRALALLHERRAPTLSAAALAAGYYDQAHMNGEFRELGALTPGEFVSATRTPNWISMAEPA